MIKRIAIGVALLALLALVAGVTAIATRGRSADTPAGGTAPLDRGAPLLAPPRRLRSTSTPAHPTRGCRADRSDEQGSDRGDGSDASDDCRGDDENESDNDRADDASDNAEQGSDP